MTKKLEEVFNIKADDDDEMVTPIEDSKEIIEVISSDMALTEKIDAALPMVTDLNEHDRDMDDIHRRALNAFQELFTLGMNVEVHAGAKLMETANQMLKTAMEAKDSKVDRKLRMLNLQMQKAKLDHQIEKTQTKDDGDFETEGRIVMDRNELMKRLAKAQGKIDDSDK